jgi:type VI secretion system secreted protein VgrG
MNPKSGSAGSPVSPAAPASAEEADVADPGQVDEFEREGQDASAEPHRPDETQTSWIEIELVGEDDRPIAGEPYRVTLPNGAVASGTLDENGLARLEGFEPGSCQVTFPNRDTEAWEKA